MPRRPRNEAPGALHHIVCQAATGVQLFVDDLDRAQFLDELRGVARDLGWQVIAYCLMSTHVHIVVCTSEPNLGRGMRRLQGRYASAHNRRHGRRGHLFGGRYWSRRIDRPHSLCCAALYAALNAVAAGLCRHPRDYAWSSYRETAGIAGASALVNADILLGALHEDVELARRAYIDAVEESLLRISQHREDEKWWQAVDRAAAVARTTG